MVTSHFWWSQRWTHGKELLLPPPLHLRLSYCTCFTVEPVTPHPSVYGYTFAQVQRGPWRYINTELRYDSSPLITGLKLGPTWFPAVWLSQWCHFKQIPLSHVITTMKSTWMWTTLKTQKFDSVQWCLNFRQFEKKNNIDAQIKA